VWSFIDDGDKSGINSFNAKTDYSKNYKTAITEHYDYILANMWNLNYEHLIWANIAVLFIIFINGAVIAYVIDAYKN